MWHFVCEPNRDIPVSRFEEEKNVNRDIRHSIAAFITFSEFYGTTKKAFVI